MYVKGHSIGPFAGNYPCFRAAAPVPWENPASDEHPHPLRSQPHRLPAHRRRAHRALLLGLRAPARRQVRPAHRGHRPGALHRGLGEGDPRRHEVARPGLGRGPVLPDAAPRALPGSRGAADRRGQGLPLLGDEGGTRRDARGSSARAARSRATTGAGGPERAKAAGLAARGPAAGDPLSHARRRARSAGTTW